MHHCQQTCAAIAIAALVSTATTGIAAAQAPAGASTPVEVRGGTASFDVGTNVPALNVHGKSTSLEARGTIRPGANGPQLEQIEATVPVHSETAGAAYAAVQEITSRAMSRIDRIVVFISVPLFLPIARELDRHTQDRIRARRRRKFHAAFTVR